MTTGQDSLAGKALQARACGGAISIESHVFAAQFWSESVAVSRAHCMPVRMYMALAAIYMHASIIAFAIGAPTFELARFVGCKSSSASLRFDYTLESR